MHLHVAKILILSFAIGAYWQPLVEEVAAEIGNAPTIIYVDCKKTAFDLATSFNQHTDIKTAAYTGEDTSKADKKAVLINWSADEIPWLLQHLLLVWVSKSQMSEMLYASEYQIAWNHGCKRLEEVAEMATTVLVCFHIWHCYG